MGELETNALRDIALKIAGHATLTLSDALILMMIALKARPEGWLICQKVMEWSNILRANAKQTSDDAVSK